MAAKAKGRRKAAGAKRARKTRKPRSRASKSHRARSRPDRPPGRRNTQTRASDSPKPAETRPGLEAKAENVSAEQTAAYYPPVLAAAGIILIVGFALWERRRPRKLKEPIRPARESWD